MIRIYLGKLIYHLRMLLEKSFDILKMKLILAYERNEAHCIRNKVIKKNGVRVANREIIRTIKEYSKKRFGTSAYWPYLALYAEIRGEYINGWLPYDYYRFVLLPKINPKPDLFLSDQKTFDFRLFGDFAVKPILLFISGVFFNTEMEAVNSGEVRNFLSEYNQTIVVKEEGGLGGKQVRFFHSTTFIPEDLDAAKNYVIQPYVEQFKVLNDLYPHSVNTLRVNTFLKKDGTVCVKYVWLRFGIDGSKVDNVSSGGNYLFFDSSGKPENFVYEYKFGFKVSNKHKNTGFVFSDLKIPMFYEILEKCKKAHLKYPYSRLIAWDVCIDRFGEPKLIEWNASNPDFYSQEARFGPFWSDDNEFQ